MGRIKLEIPEYYVDTIAIPVRINDINYGNHLGNDALVSIVHESRVQWLQKNSYTELDIEGSSIIMNELVVNYLHESFYGDKLEIRIFIGDVSAIGFELYYQIFCQRKALEIEIAKVKTGLVFFNYDMKKAVPIPKAFREKILTKR